MTNNPTPADQSLEIVFNLSEWAEGIYLPEAFIVKKEADGALTHLMQKATPATLPPLGITPDADQKKLLDLIDLLQPAALEQRYNATRKKKSPLADLLQEEDIKSLIINYIHRQLDQWLSIIHRRNFPLSWKVARKVLVKDFLVKMAAQPLQPVLSFEKTAEGVNYRLSALAGERPVRFRQFDELAPLTNEPGWLLADYTLYRLEHINGNMVKPFRQKDEVAIPGASAAAYFRKFILKVASRADIQAEGFGVTHDNRLQACLLTPVRNLFGEQWVLSIQMAYANASFNWSDKKDRRTSLEIEGDDIHIVKVTRDAEAENRYIQGLPALGLFHAEGSFFQPENQPHDDPYYLLGWLAAHRETLENKGYTLAAPIVEDKPLYLYPAALQLSAGADNDWFDLHGEIRVGEFVIPFHQLAPYIKSNNRFFILPNGDYFLIPLEWMARYQSLVQFAKKTDTGLRLAKSQYTLLEELELQHDSHSAPDTSQLSPPAQLKAELRPYQLEGMRWLAGHYQQGLGALLADDMGLGKTLQTIAMLLYAKAQLDNGNTTAPALAAAQLDLFQSQPHDLHLLKPLGALLIMPASLIFNWEQEIKRFAPSLSICNHTGAKRYTDLRLLRRFDVLLTTYQTALRDEALLQKMEFEYIVLDESQQIKNPDSKIFKAVNSFQARHKISLSGTPIENSLSDLWAQMQFINPGLLGNYAFFRKEFISPIEKNRDEQRSRRLRSLVQPYLLRRAKEEVAKDLPPLTTKIFYSEMTAEQKKIYEKEKSAARNALLDSFDAHNPQFKLMVLQSLTRLRQLVNHPGMVLDDYAHESGKYNDVLEHWDIIRRSGHKALFFSSFVKYLDYFRQHFETAGMPYAWLSGDVETRKRAEQVQRFEQQKEVQSFLISIKAGGAGLNLTAADYVFILDPWWNPATEQQAIARAHRIGQDKQVIAVKFITKDSIEEKIMALQSKKAQLADDIVNANEQLNLSKDEIAFLLS